MTEVWLRPNHRPIVLAMLLPAVLALASIGAIVLAPTVLWRVLGIGGVLFASVTLGGLSLLLRPRLACDGDTLLVQLRMGPPERVPLRHVEVFFFGQGAAMTTVAADPDDEGQDQTRNVVVRIAESATDLHQRDVEPRMGRWAEGYIVIRGTHCEPLNKEVMRALNQKLQEAHRKQKEG